MDTLFLAVEEKVSGSKGFETKTIMDDGAQRAFDFAFDFAFKPQR